MLVLRRRVLLDVTVGVTVGVTASVAISMAVGVGSAVLRGARRGLSHAPSEPVGQCCMVVGRRDPPALHQWLVDGLLRGVCGARGNNGVLGCPASCHRLPRREPSRYGPKLRVHTCNSCVPWTSQLQQQGGLGPRQPGPPLLRALCQQLNEHCVGVTDMTLPCQADPGYNTQPTTNVHPNQSWSMPTCSVADTIWLYLRPQNSLMLTAA